jgi:hypothetical protein
LIPSCAELASASVSLLVGFVNAVFTEDAPANKASSTFASAKTGYIPNKSHPKTILNNTSLFLRITIGFPVFLCFINGKTC